MTPTPGGQPKPQSSQQPGNEPGGANGMYGRFGQTPGQQPSQGFRQKVDGVRRGFGGRQQRGGMRQGGGMGQMQNNNAQGQAPQQDPVGYDGRPVQRQGSGMGPATANARQADRSQDQGREAYSKQLRSLQQPQGQPEASSYRTSGQYDRDRAGGMQDNDVAERETGFNSDPRNAQAAAMGNQRLGQMQNAARSFIMSRTPGVAPQGDSLGINGQPVDRSEQGNSVSDRGYGRFAPGPAADAPSGDTSAQERAAANPFGGAGYGSGTAFGNVQQPMNDAASTDPTIVANREAKRAAQSTPVAPVQNTQNMGGQQSPPVAQTTQATPAPSGFASPFGMMRFGAPPAQPEQPKAEDMQPRETFQTGQSSLRQPLPSLEGQSRRRQRDRFGYGA